MCTRRAIEIRDRCCTFPGCNIDVEWCQVDHIIEFTDGGPTTQDNGRLLCPTHNRQRPGRRTTPAHPEDPADVDPDAWEEIPDPADGHGIDPGDEDPEQPDGR